MHLIIAFIYSFLTVTIPPAIYYLCTEILKIEAIGNLFWALILYGSLFLAWLIAPIAGYFKAREVFFGKNNAKGKKLPPKVKIAALIVSIVAMLLGYLILGLIFTHHYNQA